MSQDPVTGTGPTDTNPVAAPGAPETDLVKVTARWHRPRSGSRR